MRITIVGPRSVGKSTVSRLLADKLNYDYIEADKLMDEEMKKYGGLDKSIKDGKTDLIIKKSLKIVNNALKKDDCVFDLAGGAISSRRTGYKIANLINKKSIVVGLLPFEDNEKSINFLFQREKNRKHFGDMKIKELKAKVKKDYLKLKLILKKSAKFVLYVGEKKSDLIVDKILGLI
jgi:shikimate kinase